MKSTLVLGASDHPYRYAGIAINRLLDYGYPVLALGKRPGKVREVEILTDPDDPAFSDADVDTITVYLNPANQRMYYDWILDMKPQRVIFNPGAENNELGKLLLQHGITPVNACTLVMLSTGQY